MTLYYKTLLNVQSSDTHGYKLNKHVNRDQRQIDKIVITIVGLLKYYLVREILLKKSFAAPCMYSIYRQMQFFDENVYKKSVLYIKTQLGDRSIRLMKAILKNLFAFQLKKASVNTAMSRKTNSKLSSYSSS